MSGSEQQPHLRRLRQLTAKRSPRTEAKLAPIGLAIGGTLFLALTFAAGVTLIGLHFLHFKEFQPEPELSAATLYDLLKVAFALAAGVGAVIALVTGYRRQRVAEFAQDLAARSEEREMVRLFNERFATAVSQLGHDNPAVRLAGVYAIAGLADDWDLQRQTCIDVLCAYLRMPYEPEPALDAPAPQQRTFRAFREVRHTIIRVITEHLRGDGVRTGAPKDWRGLDFNFTDVVLDGGDFRRAQFTGGEVRFFGVHFTSGTVRFDDARFAGGEVHFDGARFISGVVPFSHAQFTGSKVYFNDAQFEGGEVYFDGTQFTGGAICFDRAQFKGGTLHFEGARFTGPAVDFTSCRFEGTRIDLASAEWPVPPLMPPWAEPPPGVVLPFRAATPAENSS